MAIDHIKHISKPAHGLSAWLLTNTQLQSCTRSLSALCVAFSVVHSLIMSFLSVSHVPCQHPGFLVSVSCFLRVMCSLSVPCVPVSILQDSLIIIPVCKMCSLSLSPNHAFPFPHLFLGMLDESYSCKIVPGMTHT